MEMLVRDAGGTAGSSPVISLDDRQGHDPVLSQKRMRVALVGNFAPRKCGIATFTTDIFERLGEHHPEVRLQVYALQDPAAPVAHQGVHAEIDRDDVEAYARAARAMNAQGIDALWIQHEFGIFGGESGEHVLALAERVAAPLVVTLHTVLADPSPKQEEITRRLAARASRLIVMSQAGRALMIERYDVDPARISIVEHGAPDRPLRLSATTASGARKTLMTFGLLGPGKGLETAIEALPAIVARHPAVVYRIAGVSHPNELRRNGEAYRRGLEALAERLGVAAHIEWIDRFVGGDELVELLEACDIYLTPYPNLQQSTSGTLSYAAALGRAIVSTPYVHACELLSDVGGDLVAPRDPTAIAEAVNRLLDHPDELEALQLRTYRRARKTVWRHFAANSKAVLEAAIAPENQPSLASRLATPSLAAFDALCDGTGILQHGRGVVPDRNHGYCLDDNVRALMLVSRVQWRDPGEELRRASPFASFLQHAWNGEARAFRNFMNYDRTWCEDVGSEDSNARAIWALGDTYALSRVAPLRDWALHAFDTYGGVALRFGSPRSVAFAALGAAAILRQRPDHALAREIVARGGDFLDRLLGGARRPDWTWFEAVVGYDNARLPQALLECGRLCGEAGWIEAGLGSLRWILDQQSAPSGQFRPVGSDSFGKPGDILPFDQQPLEAWAAVDACASAWEYGGKPQEGGDPLWLDRAGRAYRWFLGENDRGAMLADPALGICLDGVTPHGANRNCGAESLLAFQLAYYTYVDLIGRAGRSRRENAVTGSRD